MSIFLGVKNKMSFATFIISLAIISVLLQILYDKLFRKPKTIEPEDLENSIFVVLVSYRDRAWVQCVVDILDKASISNRIFIGVIEYIDSPQNSMIEYIPKKYRHQIRVQSYNYESATNLRDSRQLCVQEMFHHERFVLFTRSCTMCYEWDNIICEYLKLNDNCIISTDLPKIPQNNFPTINYVDNKLTIISKEFSLQRHQAIQVILCYTDFAIMESHITKYFLQDDTSFGISAILHHNEIPMLTTGQCIATKSTHPRGVRQGTLCKVKESLMNEFWTSLKIYPEIKKMI